MSLLNDALKAAEQRQNRPQIRGAYTGQTQAQPATRSKVPLVLLLLILVLAAGGAAWWWLAGQQNNGSQESSAQPVAEPSEPAPPEPTEPEVSEPEPEVVAQKPEAPEPAPEPPVTEREPPIQEAQAQEPQTQEPQEPTPQEQKPQAQEPANPKPEAEDTKPEAAATSVKQQRETPEAVDRRTSRQLEDLLASGRTVEAEQRLTALTANQPAPESREAFAREMLVQQRPARALQWLPQNLTGDYASLRLLRARAQLEQGNLDMAVATLSSQVPPVGDNVEYRITLATLLQQAGETEKSAGHWSELIEHDNNQPAWWLGLAMALDAGGRTNSAVRAYAQAATMPGLSESLADYARQRLQALQAGS